MAVKIDLPKSLEERLRQELGDVSAAGKEAMLVELFRLGRLSHRELSEALGLTRFETDAVLKRHNVTEDLLTPEEYRSELKDLDQLLRG